MYECPVKISYDHTKMVQEADNRIMATIQQFVSVDRDELLRALQYDRGQYEKGYEDGKRDSMRHGYWIGEYSKERLSLDEDGRVETEFECAICSECGEDLLASEEYFVRGRYCPACGAKMDGKESGE